MREGIQLASSRGRGCRGQRQCVQMIVFEGFFCHLRGLLRHSEVCAVSSIEPFQLRLYLVHIACHQLDAGVVELLAALVVERHPTHQVQSIACLRCDDVVIAGPA